ncbi:MAG: rod shape-determining protein MreC [Bryobacterales bacterium]|nr:rod shape-determining protein MreC [Bryobacteraceae bacterium]MDW8129596.1 rod shape-determining protein MreC [Bryobacterales bacterium]
MQLLTRYRNLTVLLALIFAQLLLLAYQVRTNEDVRLIRVWAVTAVTPLARLLEGLRSAVTGFFESYVLLHNAVEENRRLRAELGRLKLENQFLKTELATAERAQALAVFQQRNPSRTLAARVIGAGVGATSRVVFVDRGSAHGVMRGMAVITPDGIVGKVVTVFPTAAQVQLVTDPTFAAGVVSEKHRVRGALKGQGHGACRVDYIQAEEKVEVGEWFYTSGDDRVFPRGLPVGMVTAVRDGNPFKEVFVAPSGLQGGLEEVLIVLEGVHLELPPSGGVNTPIHLLPPPPGSDASAVPRGPATDADRLLERYRAIGEAQGHRFGEGAPGAKPPDFNLDPSTLAKPAGSPSAQAAAPARTPSLPGSQQGTAPPSAPPPAARPAQVKP